MRAQTDAVTFELCINTSLDNQSAIFTEQMSEIHRKMSSSPETKPKLNTFSRNGMTFYIKHGQVIEDYKDREKPIWALKYSYNAMQQTLICCECDWSFTLAIINNRGSGLNLVSTTLMARKDWFNNTSDIKTYQQYFINLRVCEAHSVHCAFGIDATELESSQSLWNTSKVSKFDRICCSFPRVYDKTWNKQWYNKENEFLMFELLKSYKQFLSDNGQIEILLFQDQFFHFRMNESLKKLDLELKCWYKMNPEQMKTVYIGYVPRDTDGHYMKMRDPKNKGSIMILCCFGLKKEETEKTEAHENVQLCNLCSPIAVGKVSDTVSTAFGSPVFTPLDVINHSALFPVLSPLLPPIDINDIKEIEQDEELNSEIFDSVCETLQNKYNVRIKQEVNHKNEKYVITNDARSGVNGWYDYTVWKPTIPNLAPTHFNVNAKEFKMIKETPIAEET